MTYFYLPSAFTITFISLLALKPAAKKLGLIDVPGGRKTHMDATPLIGGIGIFLGVFCISFIMPGMPANFTYLLALSAVILLIGTVDDARELTPFIRMLGHSITALIMTLFADIKLSSLGALLTQNTIDLGLLTIPVTIFATIGVINAINMSDGIDGLSGGLASISFGFIALLSFSNGSSAIGSFCLVSICSIAAFLMLNFRRLWHKKALVYLGDAGSTMLGFMLAWLLISSTQGKAPSFEPVYALWFIAIPLFDTVNLLIKRPLRGDSPFRPGHDHLHHMLLSRGFSVEQVVFLILFLSLVCGGIGLIGISLEASESLMFQIFIALFSLYFLFADRISPKQSTHVVQS